MLTEGVLITKRMEVIGAEGVLIDDAIGAVRANQARFVIYQYAIGALVISFLRSSKVHYTTSTGQRVRRGIRYTLLSLVIGLWGKHALIWTIRALFVNSFGGTDVSSEVLKTLRGPSASVARDRRDALRRARSSGDASESVNAPAPVGPSPGRRYAASRRARVKLETAPQTPDEPQRTLSD